LTKNGRTYNYRWTQQTTTARRYGEGRRRGRVKREEGKKEKKSKRSREENAKRISDAHIQSEAGGMARSLVKKKGAKRIENQIEKKKKDE